MKKKGTRAERELLHLFWENNWVCSRIAGSGSTSFPSPDLIAGNPLRTLAIECKSIKGTYKQLNKEKIDELLSFANKFGSEAWLAIRFDNIGWYFLDINKLPLNKNGNYSITLDLAKERGVKIEELIQS